MSGRLAATGPAWAPDHYLTLSVGAEAWTPSAWVEAIAAMPEAGWLSAVTIRNSSAFYAESTVAVALVEVAVGAAGSEAVIYAQRLNDYRAVYNGFRFTLALPVALALEAGVRVSMRVRTSRTASTTWVAALAYYVASAGLTQATSEHQHSLPDTLDEIAMVESPTVPAWAWGAWVEMTPDTLGAILITEAHTRGVANYSHHVQFGIGSAGAESEVALVGGYGSSYGLTYNEIVVPNLVPRGRLAVRIRASSGVGVPVPVSLSYIPVEAAAPTEIEFDPDADVSGETVGLTWVELVDAAGTRHVSSDADLADPADYYGGFKEAEVLEWGSIRRALSDYRGQPQSTTFWWTVSDLRRKWRGLLANAATATLLNTAVVERMISDAARRAGDLARTIVRGLVRGYEPQSPLKFKFSAEDTLSRLMTTKVPRRLITSDDFAGLETTATDGSVTTLAAADTPVPIIYGPESDEHVTSTGTSLTTPTGISVTVVGGTAGETKKYAITLLNGDYGDPNLRAWDDHRGETDPAWITVVNAPTDEDMMSAPASHYLVISVDSQVGAVSGRCYGRYPSSIFGLDALDKPGFLGIVPADKYQYWEARRPGGAADWNTQKHKGAPPATNSTGTTTDTGTGKVAPKYVGKETVGGVEKHVWVLAGHACSSVPSWYVNGARQATSTAEAGGVWEIPGVNSIPLYEDRNGHRYCLIRGLAGEPDPDDCASGEKTLTCNVLGIETVGDGTGTVITSLLQIYLHFLRNWGFGDYQTGAWLDSPTFPADPAPEDADVLHMIDEDSFDAAESRADSRLPGGYIGGGVIGAGADQEELRDVIALLNQSCDVDQGFSRKTQFMVSMEPSVDDLPLVTAANRITQERDIHKDTFSLQDVDTELFTVRPYCYGRRTADESWDVEGEARDDAAIAAMLGEERIAPTLELHFVSDAAVAEDIVAHALARSRRPPRRCKLKRGLAGLSDELGDVRYLTHSDGISADGWIDQPVRVLEHEINPGDFEVELVCRDLGYLFESEAS